MKSKTIPKLRWIEHSIGTVPPIRRFRLTVLGDNRRIASIELYQNVDEWTCFSYTRDGSRPGRWLGKAKTSEEAMQLVIDVLDIDPDLVDPETWEMKRL